MIGGLAMRMRPFAIGIGLAAGLMIVAPVVPVDAQGARRPEATQVNRALIDTLVPHHQMAVAMADEAINRAQHDDLKAFARKLKENQEKEITQMKQWRSSWFGSSDTPTPPKDLLMPHLPSGSEFDKAWMEHLIMHHQSAIDLATVGLSGETRPEMRELAQKLVRTQRDEQKQLRGWIDAWYPRKSDSK